MVENQELFLEGVLLSGAEETELAVVLVCARALDSWLTIAGLLMTAERSETDMGAVVGVAAVGLADCELFDTNRRAAARVGEDRAEIGDFALGVVLPEILTADTCGEPRERGAGLVLTILEAVMVGDLAVGLWSLATTPCIGRPVLVCFRDLTWLKRGRPRLPYCS